MPSVLSAPGAEEMFVAKSLTCVLRVEIVDLSWTVLGVVRCNGGTAFVCVVARAAVAIAVSATDSLVKWLMDRMLIKNLLTRSCVTIRQADMVRKIIQSDKQI
jgi:hypothetical protein